MASCNVQSILSYSTSNVPVHWQKTFYRETGDRSGSVLNSDMSIVS